MYKYLLMFALIAALMVPIGCSSEDDDDDPAPAPAFGPNLIAVGDDGEILTSGDTQTWTLVTTTGNLATLDMVEVVRVPGHANRRLVTYGDDSATTADSEIWYSDDGGSTWTAATITESAGYWTTYTFDINDMHFMNALEGIAVGTAGLVLFTADAGATWTELNTWSDSGGTVTAVELGINTITGTSGDPIQGTTISQDQGGGDTVTADVTCFDDEGTMYLVANNIVLGGSATGFNTTDNITWGTDGDANVSSVDATDIWHYEIDTANCVFGVETAGTGTATTLTIWFANGESDDYDGMWKLVSSAADPGTTRTWTWTSPTPAIQASAAVGDFGYDTAVRFFFFDAMTGVVARQVNGILYTEDGGATWTYAAGTDINTTSISDEYWSEFWYINNGGTGWLYSLENDGAFTRVGIIYSATATPPYQFNIDATNDWENLLPAGTNNSALTYLHNAAVLYSNKLYALADNDDDWTYGTTMGSTAFDDDVFSDTMDQYLGGVTANGDNPAYQKDIAVGTTTYYMNHWTER